MIVLDVVLRQSAVVLSTLLVQEVYGVGLLQESAALVFLIRQDVNTSAGNIQFPL